MTRIDIQTPSEVGETARVLQLANQRRLAERQAEGWAEREAERLAERARSFVGNPASRAARNDPWRGAVPEFDPPPGVRARIPGKRFKVAGAYFQWRYDNLPTAYNGRLLIWTADKQRSEVVTLPYPPQWYEVLPAGGDRVVLLFYGYSLDVQYTPQQAETDTGWLPGAPNVATGGGGTVWHTATLRNRTVTIESWTTATASLDEYRITATVRKDGISHKLSWPDSLRQVIEQKYKCAKSVRKKTTPTQKSVTRYEYGQRITNTYTYKATGGSVPNDVFHGTGEIIETMPQYDSSGVYDPYGGGAWVPVDSLPGGIGNQLYYYRYPPHPAVDAATMNTLGQTVNYTPSTFLLNTTEGSTHQSEDYEVVFTPNAYQSPTLLQYGSPGGGNTVGIFVWHPLMKSYGYGYLVNRDAEGQTPGWGWTPAVFSFLKNYDGEFHKEDGDTSMLTKANSYQHARDNYIPQDAPPYFLTTNVTIPDATVDTTKTYYYFRAPIYDIPLDYSNPLTFRTENNTIAPVTLRPNRGDYTREVLQSSLSETQKSIECSAGKWYASQLEIPVAAWDWDRPLACWLELLRLGFTTADLMLSDDEVKAIAEADPVTTAFKF